MTNWNETIQTMFAEETKKFYNYIIVNMETKRIVSEFEAESAEEARMFLVPFNERCKLYTAGALND